MKSMTRDWEPWRRPEYAESRLKIWGNPLDPPSSWNKNKYMRLRVLPKMILGKSVLDVGCGLGHTYSLIKNTVDEYLGLDLPAMIEICHRFFPKRNFKVGDIYDLSPWGLYHTVISTQVLIHLPHLNEPLKQLWKHAERCILVTVRFPREKEIFKQRENGLIGHRWTKEQLVSAINNLNGVGKVEAWRGTRCIYLRVSKTRNPRGFKVKAGFFSLKKMPLAHSNYKLICNNGIISDGKPEL